MLRIEHLSVWYDVTEVIRDVSLEVPSNSIVALMGGNGAGKSTILNTPRNHHTRQHAHGELSPPGYGEGRRGSSSTRTLHLAGHERPGQPSPRSLNTLSQRKTRDQERYG